MFYGIWNIIQYFLPPKTRERVCPQLSTTGCLQYVEPQYLPITMGGTSAYEPDIDTLEDPPSMIHSILSKTKKLSPQRTMKNNGNSLNYSQPSPLPSSQISRISDYRRVSVSIDINDDEEDDGLEEYAASEFGDELNLYRSSENNSTQITPLNGQKLSTEKINKFSPFSSLTSSKYRQYCPAMMKGWGIKQGHIVKNWKRRYFILTSQHEVTLLRYYKEELSYPPYGEYLCGELNLQYYHLIPSQKLIKFDSNENEQLCNCIELIGESSLDKDLLICIEDSSEYNSWIGALEAHIDFRKEIEDILQQESSRSSWRCNIL